MPAKINLYNLGSMGVDLTRSPLHKADGALVAAQNAVPDVRGEAGGLTKRDGLVAVNSTSAGGSLLGAVNAQVGSGTFGAGLSGNRVFYSSAGLSVWRYSDDYWDTSAGVANAGEALDTGDFAGITGTGHAGPFAVVYNNQVYFADGQGVRGTDQPNITIFDGAVDKVFVTVPNNPDAAVVTQAVSSMVVNEGTIYLTTWDVGTATANLKGSVYSLNPITGVLTKLGATFPTTYLPWKLCWHGGRLWCGTFSEDVDAAGRVYWIRPGIDTAWTLDHTTTAGQGQITTLCEYRGELFAGTTGNATVAALVKKRTTLGVWSTSATGPEVATGSYYHSMAVYLDKLYVVFERNGGAANETIDVFDGTSWSTAYNLTSNGHSASNLFDAGQYLLAMSASAGAAGVLRSATGASWAFKTDSGTTPSPTLVMLAV